MPVSRWNALSEANTLKLGCNFNCLNGGLITEATFSRNDDLETQASIQQNVFAEPNSRIYMGKCS